MTDYNFALFVVNSESIQNKNLIQSIKDLLDFEFKGFCKLKIIDILTEPEQTHKCGIIIAPTLTKCSPGKIEKMFGDFNNKDLFREILERINNLDV